MDKEEDARWTQAKFIISRRSAGPIHISQSRENSKEKLKKLRHGMPIAIRERGRPEPQDAGGAWDSERKPNCTTLAFFDECDCSTGKSRGSCNLQFSVFPVFSVFPRFQLRLWNFHEPRLIAEIHATRLSNGVGAQPVVCRSYEL